MRPMTRQGVTQLSLYRHQHRPSPGQLHVTARHHSARREQRHAGLKLDTVDTGCASAGVRNVSALGQQCPAVTCRLPWVLGADSLRPESCGWWGDTVVTSRCDARFSMGVVSRGAQDLLLASSRLKGHSVSLMGCPEHVTAGAGALPTLLPPTAGLSMCCHPEN